MDLIIFSKVKKLCTDSRVLQAEYCNVGIPHNTAI